MTTALTIQAIEGEPRVLDTDLAVELGYERPRDIRKLVKRHEATLTTQGTVCATVEQTSPQGGRPSTEYRLNRAQALFIITKAETTRAADVTVAVIEKFLAYEAGLIQARPTLPDFTDPGEAAIAWGQEYKARQLADKRAKEEGERASLAEAKVAELEPLALVGKMTASRSLRLADFLRTFPGLNVPKTHGRLVEMGVLYRHKGKVRVSRSRYGTHFLEGPEDEYGNVTIFPNAGGKALLIDYFKKGKLPMKAGCKPQSLRKALA